MFSSFNHNGSPEMVVVDLLKSCIYSVSDCFQLQQLPFFFLALGCLCMLQSLQALSTTMLTQFQILQSYSTLPSDTVAIIYWITKRYYWSCAISQTCSSARNLQLSLSTPTLVDREYTPSDFQSWIYFLTYFTSHQRLYCSNS